MDIVGDKGVWGGKTASKTGFCRDLGPLTLHARTRRESKSSAMSCSSCSTMDILILVRGDVGQRDGSGDLLAMSRVVFIDVSNAWGSFWDSWFWGSGCRVICCG